MAFSYTTQTYLGRTMHIVTVTKDSTTDVRLTLMALPFGQNVTKTTINWRDSQLENTGWIRKAVINGGLFFTQNNVTFANGIERSSGVTHENDDAGLDGVMATYFSFSNEATVYVDLQSSVKTILNTTYGAVTGAFGLLKDGAVVQGNTSLQGNYNSKSGRSMIGYVGNTVYLVATAGVTGSTGLTGPELLAFAQQLGLTNAIALDGGGSVGLVYDDIWRVSSTRLVKNAIGVYTKVPDPVTPPSVPSPPTKPWSFINVNGSLKQIVGAKVMVNGALKDIPKAFSREGGSQKLIFEKEITSTNFPQQFGTTYTWSTTSSTQSASSMTSTNNPYIKTFTTNNFAFNPPSAAFNNNFGFNNNASTWDTFGATWTIEFNAKVAFQSFTVHGWGQNDSYLNSPAGTTMQGSNNGTSWTTIYNATIPHAWMGDSINYGSPTAIATQIADSRSPDPNVGFGPLGAKTVTALSNKDTFFRYLRIIWNNNWELAIYNARGGADNRYYWQPARNGWGGTFPRSERVGLLQLTFNVKIRPL